MHPVVERPGGEQENREPRMSTVNRHFGGASSARGDGHGLRAVHGIGQLVSARRKRRPKRVHELREEGSTVVAIERRPRTSHGFPRPAGRAGACGAMRRWCRSRARSPRLHRLPCVADWPNSTWHAGHGGSQLVPDRYVRCHHEVGDNYNFSNDDIPASSTTRPRNPPAVSPAGTTQPPRPRHIRGTDARDQCTNTICRACAHREYIAARGQGRADQPESGVESGEHVTALANLEMGAYAGWEPGPDVSERTARYRLEATPTTEARPMGRPRGPATMRSRGGFSKPSDGF